MASSLDLLEDSSDPVMGRAPITPGQLNGSANLIDSESMGLFGDTTTEITGLESQQEEELTAEEVLKRLQEAWTNEKFAPELLEPQIEVVDCLLTQLDSTEQDLKNNRGRDKMGHTLHKMEMARVRFLISAYLRIRLAKIERNIFHIVDEVAQAQEAGQTYRKLTKDELKFAQDYKESLDTLFKDLALDHLPGKAADFSSTQARKSTSGTAPVPSPNLNSSVFVKAVRDIRGVVIEDEAERGRDEEYDMAAGSQHVINYKCIASYLKRGDVKLV